MADRRLQIFHAVAKYRSFTRAADALFMTQPAVTFQIRQLEEEVRARLFERRHGRIDLTPAGELVLGYAEKILALSEEMDTRLAEMTGEMRGVLTVGASFNAAEVHLPRILGDFNALYPRVRVRMTVGNTAMIEQQVANHALEVGVIDLPPHLPGLAAYTAAADEFSAVCAPDYPLSDMHAVTPAILAEYEFISREPGSGTRGVVDAYFRAQGVAPEQLKTQMELGSPQALKAVVQSGLGYAVMPTRSVERELEGKALVAIALDPPLRGNIHLVYPDDRFQARVAAAFIEFSRQKLKDQIS